jgi:alpha-1,2-mannosyltransferase
MSRLEAAPVRPTESPAGRFGARAATTATVIVLAVVPLVVGGFFLAASYAHDTLAYDLRHAYLPAAEALVDGESPYPELDDPRLAAEQAYVYPPLVGWALAPATLLSENAASIVAALVTIGLVLGILLVLEVRDWRCYGAALLWAPTLIGIQTASASVLVAFLVALAWRYRERTLPFSASLGGAIAVKLFAWPLLVWALAMRRGREAVAAVVVAAAAILLPWAPLAFEDLGRYPTLLERLADLVAPESYSLVGVAEAVGLGETAGRALGVACGGALLGVCVVLGRRGDDLRSFTAAVAAALAFTPVLWQHYLVLLLVPLALSRPRVSALWLLPIGLWLAEREDNGEPVQTVLPMLVAGILVAALLARPASATSPRPAEARR